MKKRAVAFLLTAAVVFGLTGCGGRTESGKDSGKASQKAESGKFQASGELDPKYACTIDVIGVWGNFEALDQAAKDFKEYYPNIEVVYSPLSDVNTDMKNRMVSGNEIDIYMHNWFNTNDSSKAFLWENAADLSEMDLNLECVDPNLLKTGYVDGKLKMIPMYRRMYGFMVNEDLLKEHELSIPETYGEFLACCEKLQSEGIAPVLIQGALNLNVTYNQHIVAQTMRSKEKDSVMADAMEGKDSLGAVEETLQMMEELTQKGYVHPDSGQLDDEYESVILRFFEGDIPFVPYNSEQFSGTRKREAKSEHFSEHPFTYHFIPFPGENGYECVYEQLGSMYMGMYNGIEEEKQPYVCELLRYLLSDEGNYTLEHIKNMPGSNKNTGLDDFPCFQGLKDEQIFAVGKDGLRLDYTELLLETYTGYEEGITAEEYLSRSMEYIQSKKK